MSGGEVSLGISESSHTDRSAPIKKHNEVQKVKNVTLAQKYDRIVGALALPLNLC